MLGGHQVATIDGGPTGFLIDDHIAIDAGGTTRGLNIHEQARIDTILLTHHHFDHIRDLPMIGLVALDLGRQIDIHCSDLVKDILEAHILNGSIWINFFTWLNPVEPTFRHHRVDPGKRFRVGPYDVLPIDNRHHPVPVTGYEICTPENRRLLYTGDTGPGIRDIWGLVNPDVLITEVTWPNDKRDLAGMAGHMTPELLADELEAFRAEKSRLPDVYVCHVNQYYGDTVARELVEASARLGIPIRHASEGVEIVL